jgi:muconolactone delta-isomerase
MPLRLWRSDEVTPLSAHPNDPGRQTSTSHSAPTERQGSEFFVTFTLEIPAGTPADTVTATTAAEAKRAAELAAQGHLLRLWALPDQGRALGLWKAHDSAEMQAILQSLPLDVWLTVQTTPLSQHPSDPALTSTKR